MEEEKKVLTAIGIDVDGKEHRFNCTYDRWLFCHNINIISLTIPTGVKRVTCSNNQLTELILPEGIKKVICNNNQLTDINIPMGVEVIECESNKITQLKLPSSVKRLWADKEVTGLEKKHW